VLGPSLWANKGSQAKWRLKEDAGYYIIKVPKTEHEAPEWQAAMEALILVATLGGRRCSRGSAS
jgi:hypothetical protein